MKVNAQSVNFTADGKLIDFVQKRMDKMEVFYDKVIESDVYLKVENTSAKENKIVEIMVFVPRDKFMVKNNVSHLKRLWIRPVVPWKDSW